MRPEPVTLKPARGLPALHQRRRTILWILLCVYAILAVGLFWPSPPWSADTLPAGVYQRGFGDPAQMTWFLEWIAYAMRHGMNIFHTNYLDYPLGVDLANGTSVPLLGIVAAPFTLTLGPVAAFNLLLRVAFASSAGAMFLVLRNWTRTWVAFLGGLVYGFGPYMIDQGQNHLNLVFVPIPPLIAWCLYELLFVHRRSPVRMGLLLGALAGAQALINPELLAMMGLVVLIGLVALVLFSPRHRTEWLLPFVRALPFALLVFLVVSGYLIWAMFFAPGHLVGTVYPSNNLQVFRSDLLEPIIPTDNQFIAPLSLAVIAYRFAGGNFSENAGYLSLPFVMLFAVFSVRWRKDRIVLYAAVLAVFSFVLSLGSRLAFQNKATHFPLPEALLVHFPLFGNIVPARFSFLVALFSVIAVAVGAEHFLRDVSGHRTGSVGTRLANLSIVALALAAAVLLFPLAPLSTQRLPWASDIPATLNAIPAGSVVLNYPFTLDPWTEAMSWQAADEMNFRIIGGYVTEQNGKNFGESFPVLLRPKIVEETMIKAQIGTNKISGEQINFPKPNAKVNVQPALCTFLRRYHVTAVVFWKGGAFRGVNPGKIHRLFSAALGKPTVVNSNDTLLIWLTNDTHCFP